MVGGIAQEIDARSEVLRIERELEEARSRLTAIRRAKYRGEGDSDAEGYMSGYDSSTMETSGYRTANLNGSDLALDASGGGGGGGSQFVLPPDAASSPQRLRPIYQPTLQQQAYQNLQRDQRSVSPVTPLPKKQPPATPPRLSSAAGNKSQTAESPLMILQRQRQLLETSANNSSIEDHTPSFSESRQRFNNSSGSSTFNSSVSTFHSPATETATGAGGYYTAMVRNAEQVTSSTTTRMEKMSISSTSRTYSTTTQENK